jgi:RNA polymerase sigma-70 factor, ECF subfamily
MAWHDQGVDDRALVAAVLAGDRDAFDLVVDRDMSAVYGAALRILGSPMDAEDVVQEAYVTAYRAIEAYRGDGTLRAWVTRIATRLAFRRLGQRRPMASISDVPESGLADPAGDPSSSVLADERGHAVREAVAGLPQGYREVVALRFFGDLSLAEIADTTGRPLNTVKTHLRRGLERLKPLAEARRAR